jgi:hypothetical protein
MNSFGAGDGLWVHACNRGRKSTASHRDEALGRAGRGWFKEGTNPWGCFLVGVGDGQLVAVEQSGALVTSWRRSCRQ